MNWLFHIGIAQSLFAALFLFARRRQDISDKLLAWWMIFISLELWHMLFEVTKSPWHGVTSNFGFYALTFGPFLYLYTLFITGGRVRWRMREFWHFGPYFLFSLLHVVFFTNKSIRLEEIQFSTFWFILNISRVVALLVSLSVYSLLSIRILRKHEKSIRDDYSYDSLGVNLGWLRHIIAIFVFTYLALILNLLTGNIAYLLFNTSHLIPAAGLTFFCFFLSFYGFNQPSIARKASEQNGSKDNIVLSKEKRRALIASLEKFMTEERPYLNPELTMSELAEGMKLPRHYITEILKVEMNKNFFVMVNDYRVEAVKHMLQNPQSANMSLLTIALECGFNSKSSFNALFKQHTGLTPSDYRRSVIKKPE
ncbi:MAG: helix-turn-helix domain-containing protein [Cyclobacteriaceae bacterium]|nr:helix-turn-helix domain-containing protein [Cyclobacteriaceae bacterium]